MILAGDSNPGAEMKRIRICNTPFYLQGDQLNMTVAMLNWSPFISSIFILFNLVPGVYIFDFAKNMNYWLAGGKNDDS